MAIGKPIGQTGFISSPIVTTEQAYPHARPRGGERRDFRGTIPATAEQVEKVADYDNHRVARAGAARASARRLISNEELLLTRTADAGARSEVIDSLATLAHLAAMQAALDAQQAAYHRLEVRIVTIEGNQSIGDQS